MAHNDVPSPRAVSLLASRVGVPCISIYTPTEYGVTDDAQANRIAFGNQVKAALADVSNEQEREHFSEQFESLLEDEVFWRYQSRTLAVFASQRGLRVYRLPNRLPERTIVGDRYYIMPLLRAVTFPQSAFVLALSESSVRIVEVAADRGPEEVKIQGMPSDSVSFAGTTTMNDRKARPRSGDDGRKVRITQYARGVENELRGLLHSRGIPLILAAAEPTASIFRGINTYPELLAEGIDGNPEHLSDDDIDSRSRDILDRYYKSLVADYKQQFNDLVSAGRTQTDLSDLGRAATWGVVETLFVDIDAEVPGSVGVDDGAITLSSDSDAGAYGVVDEIARRTLLSSGKVVALRGDEVPGGSPASAIPRYRPTA